MSRKKAAVAQPAAQEEVVHSVKGFDKNLQCRGFQFEIGRTYEHDGEVEACESGFHACEHPLQVFNYYPPATSRFAAVVQSGKLNRHSDDTKIASAKITLEAELSLPQVIERAVKWVFDRAKWSEGPVVTGDNEGATASGDQGAATASGYQGAATASGDWGAATASGRWGAATASGYQGAATASGDQGAATASGDRGAVKGDKDGIALFTVYRDVDTGEIKHAWAGITGRDGVKAGTWYRLNANGQPVEVESP